MEMAVCALSFVYLIIHRFKFRGMPNSVFLGGALFAAAVLGSTLVNKSRPDQAMVLVAVLLVPAAVAVAVVNGGLFDRGRNRVFIHFLALLWLVSVIWSFLFKSPVGISGNQNWFSSTLLALSPWAFFSFYHILRSLFSKFCGGVKGNIPAGIIAFTVIAGFTFYWLFISSSRGAWFSLIAFAGFGVFLQFSKKIKAVLCIIATAAFFLFISSSYFKNMSRNDIREPLYKSTASMIMKSPVIGFGPGQFRKHYPLFRSPGHSIRVISNKVTEHPHNEILHIASQAGIPAALIWLGLFGSLVFIKVRTREGHCARFGVFILLVHSFFDKGLVSPPGNVLFLILSGILIAGWCRNRVTSELHSGFTLPAAAAGAVICMIPVGMRISAITQGQLEYRKTSVLDSMFNKGLVKGERQTILKKIYEGYMEAYRCDPFNVVYPYRALHIALEKLNSTDLAVIPLEAVKKLEGTYAYSSYLSALYHFKTADNTGDLSDAKLKLADQEITMALSLYPFDLGLSKFVIDFLISKGDKNRANALFNHMRSSSIGMFRFKHGAGSSEIVENWKNAVISGREESVAAARNILEGFKDTDDVDIRLLPGLVSPDTPLKGMENDFNKYDRKYWEEVISLGNFFGNEKEKGEAAVEKLFNTIKITRKGEFSWPSEVLELKAGSELSVACLIRISAHSRGYLSMLIKLETLDKVHWFVYMKNDDEEFLVWPSQKRIIKGHLKELLKQERLDKEAGEQVRAVKFYLFEYPQAFFLKNVYLSKIVSGVLKGFPDFCSTPSLVKINLEAFLNNHWRINYLREPFLRLEQDISRE